MGFRFFRITGAGGASSVAAKAVLDLAQEEGFYCVMDAQSHEAALALYDRLATMSSPGSHAEALTLYAQCLAAVGVQKPAAEAVTLTTTCPECGAQVETRFEGSVPEH